MANELDQVYFKNHIHRNLRASDDALGEASVHGLSLASNVQIGTTGAALKIFKLDSTGNLTTSNNFVLKGTGGAASNLVRVEGSFNVSNDAVITGSLALGISGITTTNASSSYPNITPKVELKLGTTAASYTGGIVIRHSVTDTNAVDRNIFLFFKHSSEASSGESAKFTGLMSRTNRSWANQPELGFISAGSERMFLSQNGLRIGYTGDQTADGANSTDELQVNGSSFLSGVTTINGGGQAQALRLTSAADQVYMGFYPAGIASRQAYIGFGSTGSKQLTINNEVTTGSLAISVGGSNRVRITSGGDIGFGTDSPRGDLELGGSENKTLRVGGIFRGTGTYTGLNEETTRHQIVFSSWRDVQTDTVGAKIVAINKTNYGSSPWDLVQSTDLAFFTLATQASSTDNTVERMRIRHNGYIGINTDSPTSGLDVNANALFRSGVTISGLTSLNNLVTTGATSTMSSLTVEDKLTFTEYNHYNPGQSTKKGYWSNTAAGPVSVTGITTMGWYNIASIACPTSGSYRGANFKGSILRYNTNWGAETPTELFFSGRIQFYNAASLLDSAFLYLTEGFPDNLLRLAKIADASWELQLGAYATNVAISWEVEPLYLGTAVTFTHFDRAAASLPVSVVTPTTQYHSRAGDILGRSLDLSSTLNVDGLTTINNQFFVAHTNDQLAGFTGSGTTTGGLSIYYYKGNNATPYIQSKTMLYTNNLQTGGLIYSTANSSASHYWHVGGFNSTSSERMRLNSNGLRINLADDLTTNGAASSDDLQVGGPTYLSGILSVRSNGESAKFIGTDTSYIGFYPTGASASSIVGRDGYIGFASTTNKDLYIHNAVSSGSIRLRTSGAERVFIQENGGVLIGELFNNGGSTWTKNSAQLILGGDAGTYFNVGTPGGGTGVKLLIHGHDNESADIYPLYIEDENANADFWVRGRKVTAPTRNTTVYVGGDLGIGTSAPGAALDVNSSAIVRGGLTVSGSLGVSGTTSSVFNTAITASAGASSNLWFELGTITLTLQYQQESVRIELTNDGGSGSEDQSLSASILFRVKQQNAMTGSPFVDVLVPYAMGRIAADDIIAVATQDDASAKVIKLHARLRTNYDNFKFTVLNNDLANFTYTRNAAGSVSLPAGTQYTGIAALYADSTGKVGINTSSPASGLDVNTNSVFRSGVTISGLTSLNTLTTTGVVNANSLNVSGNTTLTGTLGVSGLTSLNTLTTTGVVNANSLNVSGNTTLTGTLGVSGLTSLNTLTTTGVVNANSFNVSGDTVLSGNLGVYNTATFENIVADPASTNLLTHSENFADATWVATTVTKGTTSSVTKPNDTTGTVDSLTGNSGDSRVNKTVSPLVAGQTYTFSIWIRAVSTAGSINIYITDASGSSVTSCSYTSSFQRFSVTRTLQAGVTSVSVQIGGGSTFSSSETINVWGAQLENKPFATSYIPTVASIVSAGDALELKYPISRTVVANNLEVTGTLGVSGLTSLNTLTTTGVVNANSLNVSGAASVTGALGVSGLTSLNTLTTTGVVNANSLNVSGNASITGTLGVSGIITSTNLTGIVVSGSSATVGVGARIVNAGTGLAYLELQSSTSIGALYQSGSTLSLYTPNSFTLVSGISTFFSANNTDASFRNNLTVSGALAVTGATTLRGNTTLLGTLGVSGLTSLNTLTTTGVVNANSLNVGGNTSLTGTLVVGSTATITGNLSVTGTTTLRGNTSMISSIITYPTTSTLTSIYVGTNANPTGEYNGVVYVNFSRFGDWAMVNVGLADTANTDENIYVLGLEKIVTLNILALPVNPVAQHFSIIAALGATNTHVIAKFSGGDKILRFFKDINGNYFDNGTYFNWPSFNILVRLA